jgi:hypothetical protein
LYYLDVTYLNINKAFPYKKTESHIWAGEWKAWDGQEDQARGKDLSV